LARRRLRERGLIVCLNPAQHLDSDTDDTSCAVTRPSLAGTARSASEFPWDVGTRHRGGCVCLSRSQALRTAVLQRSVTPDARIRSLDGGVVSKFLLGCMIHSKLNCAFGSGGAVTVLCTVPH
jgi:hypothetical protein